MRRFRANICCFCRRTMGKTLQKKWPLMLFLHGSGERGTDLNKVKKHGPPKIVEQKPDFPFIVVSPQCPDGNLVADRMCSCAAG